MIDEKSLQEWVELTKSNERRAKKLWEDFMRKKQVEAVEKTLVDVQLKIKEAFSDESTNASYAPIWLRIGILDLISQITPEKVLGLKDGE